MELKRRLRLTCTSHFTTRLYMRASRFICFYLYLSPRYVSFAEPRPCRRGGPPSFQGVEPSQQRSRPRSTLIPMKHFSDDVFWIQSPDRRFSLFADVAPPKAHKRCMLCGVFVISARSAKGCPDPVIIQLYKHFWKYPYLVRK